MESVIHADIFFFVSTIALVLVTIGLVIVIIYVIRILDDMRHISEKVRTEGDSFIDDLHEWRRELKHKGFGLLSLGRFIQLFIRKKKSRRAHHEDNEDEE